MIRASRLRRTAGHPIACLVLALLLALPRPAAPQQSGPPEAELQEAELRTGDRVRISAPTLEPEPLVGRFAGGSEILLLQRRGGDPELGIPVDAVERLEVSRGKKGSTILRGAGIGLALGTAVGLAHGAACHPGLPHVGEDLPCLMEWSWLFALAGLGTGLAVGAITADEQWLEVPPERYRGSER